MINNTPQQSAETSEVWYVVHWKSRNGRRGAGYPGISEEFAREYKAGLIDPSTARIRRFANRADAFRFYYRAMAS